MMTDDEVAAVIAGVATAANPRDAYLDAVRILYEDFMAAPVNRGNTQAEREANYAETQSRIAQSEALGKAGSARGLSHEDMMTLYYAARGRESPHRPTDPERVGRLAHLLSEVVEEHTREHGLLIAEGIMATQLATLMVSRNCGWDDQCRCGEIASERANKELNSDVGAAALKLAFMHEEMASEE